MQTVVNYTHKLAGFCILLMFVMNGNSFISIVCSQLRKQPWLTLAIRLAACFCVCNQPTIENYWRLDKLIRTGERHQESGVIGRLNNNNVSTSLFFELCKLQYWRLFLIDPFCRLLGAHMVTYLTRQGNVEYSTVCSTVE